MIATLLFSDKFILFPNEKLEMHHGLSIRLRVNLNILHS